MNEGTPKSIVVASLRAENVPAVVHFYQDILGLKLRSHQPGERPHLEIGGVLLVIQPGKPQPDSDEHFPVFAFAVNDLQSAVANLQAHQIHLPWGVEQGGGTYWVKFYDPAGNLIELVQFASEHDGL